MLETKRVEKTITHQKTKTTLNIHLIRDTEQAILNYMLLSKDNFIKIKNCLRKNDFTFITHRVIFANLCKLEKMFSEDSYCGINNASSLLKVFAKFLEEKENIQMTSTLDILSQSPSMYIDSDLEMININSMEREIAIYNKKIVQNGTIETKDGKTWFKFINARLISVGTTNITHLPTELYDNFGDTMEALTKLDLENRENELNFTFYGGPKNPYAIESFCLKKDIFVLEWFDNICQWADKYNLNEDIFPRDRYKLQNLSELDISKKEIFELPKEIGKLTNLRILIMDENNIKEFPQEIYQLKSLVLLSFVKNNISYISEEIINFRNLLYFGACYNNIVSLPKKIFKLKNLEHICMHRNKMISLPDEIGYLSKLAHISISNNDIEVLPKSITKLKNLNSLDIENTKITFLPTELLKLQKLSINDDLLPFIAQNRRYLCFDTINLTASHFQNDSKIVKELNFKLDTKKWVEEQDKKENGCVYLFKYYEDNI